MTKTDDNTAGDGIATALRDVINTAIDAETLRTEVLGFNAVALPASYNIHKLEGLAPRRDRPRGVFTTDSVDDFARWVNEAGEEARTFIDARNWTATSVLNFSAPDEHTGHPLQGHCDYMARLKVTPSPEWVALRALHGQKLAQLPLVDLIEDWGHCIVGFTDTSGKSMTKAQAISAIRDVRVQSAKQTQHVAGDMRAERGMLETIEARDVDKWPATMDWNCTPAFGLQPITAYVRLTVLTSHDTPTIALRIIALDALCETVARTLSTLLQGKLERPPYAGHFDAGV